MNVTVQRCVQLVDKAWPLDRAGDETLVSDHQATMLRLLLVGYSLTVVLQPVLEP